MTTRCLMGVLVLPRYSVCDTVPGVVYPANARFADVVALAAVAPAAAPAQRATAPATARTGRSRLRLLQAIGLKPMLSLLSFADFVAGGPGRAAAWGQCLSTAPGAEPFHGLMTMQRG